MKMKAVFKVLYIYIILGVFILSCGSDREGRVVSFLKAMYSKESLVHKYENVNDIMCIKIGDKYLPYSSLSEKQRKVFEFRFITTFGEEAINRALYCEVKSINSFVRDKEAGFSICNVSLKVFFKDGFSTTDINIPLKQIDGNWYIILDPFYLQINPIYSLYSPEHFTRTLVDTIVDDELTITSKAEFIKNIIYIKKNVFTTNTNNGSVIVNESYITIPQLNKKEEGQFTSSIIEFIKNPYLNHRISSIDYHYAYPKRSDVIINLTTTSKFETNFIKLRLHKINGYYKLYYSTNNYINYDPYIPSDPYLVAKRLLLLLTTPNIRRSIPYKMYEIARLIYGNISQPDRFKERRIKNTQHKLSKFINPIRSYYGVKINKAIINKYHNRTIVTLNASCYGDFFKKSNREFSFFLRNDGNNYYVVEDSIYTYNIKNDNMTNTILMYLNALISSDTVYAHNILENIFYFPFIEGNIYTNMNAAGKKMAGDLIADFIKENRIANSLDIDTVLSIKQINKDTEDRDLIVLFKLEGRLFSHIAINNLTIREIYGDRDKDIIELKEILRNSSPAYKNLIDYKISRYYKETAKIPFPLVERINQHIRAIKRMRKLDIKKHIRIKKYKGRWYVYYRKNYII